MSDADSARDAGDEEPLEDPSNAAALAYEHDPSAVAALARLADMACEGAAGMHEASVRVRRLAENANPPADPAAVHELVITFSYTVSPHPLRSSQPGADLVPLDGPSIPRALRDANTNVHALWTSLVSTVTHPAAKARCADIIFTLKLARRDDAAEKTVRGYLDLLGEVFG